MKKARFMVVIFVALMLALSFVQTADGQSIVRTLDFRPPHVDNQVGFDYRLAVLESTGLVYIGGTASYGEEVGVIDPVRNALIKTIPVPTNGSYFNLARANQTSKLVYFRLLNSSLIAAVDGRPSSATFNQALPALVMPDIVQSFAIDESSGLMYVTTFDNDAQSWLCVVDVNPGSGSFHQLLQKISAQGIWLRGVAVNPVTHKVYVTATYSEFGVYVYNGTTLAGISGTEATNSFGVVVNEDASLVYTTAGQNRMNAIDGATDSLLKVIDLPATIPQGAFDMRLAINRRNGRVYVRSNQSPAPDKLIVVDGKRSSPTFNTVLAAIEVGRNGSSVVVDESIDRVVTNAQTDLCTFIVDGSADTVLGTIPSMQIPSFVALNRVTHQAYAANQPNFVQVIDLAKNKLTATIVTATELGAGSVSITDHKLYLPVTSGITELRTVDKKGNLGSVNGFPTSAGRMIFTAINQKTNRVYVQNSAANLAGDAFLPGFVSTISGKKVIADVTTGNQPFGLAVNETTNKVYSLDAGFGALFPGGITVIDGATGSTIQADVSAFPSGQYAQAPAAVNEATNKLYFQVAGQVGVLDGLTNVATLLPNTLAPVFNIAVNNSLNRIYISSRDANLLHILQGTSDVEIATLNMDSPSALAVNEVTGRLYVANQSANTVTVIDGGTGAVAATIPVGAMPAYVSVNELANRVYVYNAGDPSVSFIDSDTNTVDKVLALPSTSTNIDVVIVTDPGVARAYAVEGDGNAQLFVLSDTAGTLAALKQAIVSNTASDPRRIRAGLRLQAELAQLAVDRGDTRAALTILRSLSKQVARVNGDVLTGVEAERILRLIDAVIASESD